MDQTGLAIEVRVLVQMVGGVPVIEAINIVSVEPFEMAQAALADGALAGQGPWVH